MNVKNQIKFQNLIKVTQNPWSISVVSSCNIHALKKNYIMRERDSWSTKQNIGLESRFEAYQLFTSISTTYMHTLVQITYYSINMRTSRWVAWLTRVTNYLWVSWYRYGETNGVRQCKLVTWARIAEHSSLLRALHRIIDQIDNRLVSLERDIMSEIIS